MIYDRNILPLDISIVTRRSRYIDNLLRELLIKVPINIDRGSAKLLVNTASLSFYSNIVLYLKRCNVLSGNTNRFICCFYRLLFRFQGFL